MRIRVLYFDGCPGHRPALELVRQVLSDLKVEAQVEETEVRTAVARSDYAMSCRMYGASGTPPRILVEEAIRRGRS